MLHHRVWDFRNNHERERRKLGEIMEDDEGQSTLIRYSGSSKNPDSCPFRKLPNNTTNYGYPTLRRFRMMRSPSSGGISPVNRFAERYSSSSLMRLPSSGGISPVNRFE